MKIDVEEIKKFWITEAEEAIQVADHLIEKGDNSYALFFGHLAIEKLLKSIYVVKHKEHAPPIHNLIRPAKSAGINIIEDKINALIEISAFNIEARYPDLKRSFRKKCTDEFTRKQMEMIKDVYRWLKKQQKLNPP